ncbi:MAG: heavy-metal-associated domain-containing protein [Streptomycetales bacterium]
MPTTTYSFRIEGMHCASCAMLIDDALEDLPGVHHTQTTTKHQLSTVGLDTSRNSPDDVVSAIEDLGYRATSLSGARRYSWTSPGQDQTT